MKFQFIKFFFVFVFSVTAASVQAQSLKFDEVITMFTAPKYPENLFATLEERHFYRLDKQWLPKCDRVVYALTRGTKPVMFVNPMDCFRPLVNTHYPIKFKHELELQYHRDSRADFERFRAQIQKQCKPVTSGSAVAGTEAGSKTEPVKAYLHEASGVTLVIEEIGPVGFIFLIR